MFVPLPVLIVAGSAVVLLLMVALRHRGGQDDLMAPPPRPRIATAPLPGLPVTLPPDVEAQVWEYIRDEQLISAIKLAREATGLGLKEAKDLVEDMRRHDPPSR